MTPVRTDASTEMILRLQVAVTAQERRLPALRRFRCHSLARLCEMSIHLLRARIDALKAF